MIATILPGSYTFHAVNYNERKVSKGIAKLLEIKNFGPIGKFGSYTVDDLVGFLKDYSSRNDRIQKPQFHLAISCKGHEMSEQELLDFAHEYLKEMGYGEEGQPLLIYAHYDTNNSHLHIVTSRVAPNGKKIDHNNERRRSQAVIDKLLGTNIKNTAEADIEKAKQYSFSKMTQFKSILSSMGYEVYDRDDTLYVKKGGATRVKIPIAELGPLFKTTERDRKRERQLMAQFIKYRDLCNSREELTKELKKNFGIDLVFFGKADSPYGYMIIDHKNKAVMSGNQVLKLETLLDFTPKEEKLKKIDDFIKELLKSDPKITTESINKKLRRSHAYIKNGVLHYGDMQRILKPVTAAAISQNNKIHIVESFSPQTDAERDILCRLYKVDDCNRERITLAENEPTQKDDSKMNMLETLANHFTSKSGSELRSAIRSEGIILKRQDEDVFAIDMTSKRIVNLKESGFDVDLLWPKTKNNIKESHNIEKKHEPTKNKSNSNSGKSGMGKILKGLLSGHGGHGQNREWEVGKKDRFDKVDDHIDPGMGY